MVNLLWSGWDTVALVEVIERDVLYWIVKHFDCLGGGYVYYRIRYIYCTIMFLSLDMYIFN